MTEVTGIDHIYLTVADLGVSENFYDRVLLDTLEFRKTRFALAGDPHIQYYNRHFGIVLRPARTAGGNDRYSCGLHHLCLRVDSIDDVHAVGRALSELGIGATPARLYPEYAPDYAATYFSDPDDIHIEVTNYRQERRDRHDGWGRSSG